MKRTSFSNRFASQHVRALTTLAAAVAATATAQAQPVTLNASQLAFRSSGTVAGANVTLNSNGYLGTYVTLATPGKVDFSIDATGVTDGGTAPLLNLSVDDFHQGFSVTGGAYNGSVDLPAGTHFVRLDYANDAAAAPARAITFSHLTVDGATLANAATDANALAASNTYIQNNRRGDAHVSLLGPGGVPLLAGTPVRAQMVRNAFNFGGTVSGATLNDSKDMLGVTSPAAGTEQQKFQDFVKQNFNTIVPSNSGKWAYDEPTQNNVNMSLPDRQLNWAIANNKRARMHTLIWGSGTTTGNQQPTWVNTLISQAAAGNATAKANLRAAISNRIKYYAGTTGNRAQKYIEIDGLNESLHNPAYTNIFGTAGVADIYNELNAAIASSGSTAKTYLNEWNVLQYSPASVNSSGVATGSDPYANYYRQHIDDVIGAGGGVGGIGVQYYANYTQTGSNAHSAATIQKALGNLSVTGLPISMDEFGGGSTMTAADNAAGAKVLDDTVRMFYGTPNATTFMVWGWWDTTGATSPPAAFLDSSLGNAVLTPMGTRWVQLMNEFSTDTTVNVAADGAITFNGYYGDYNIGGQAAFSNLTHVKGTAGYSLTLAAPPTWSLFKSNAATNDFATATNWTGGTPGGVGTTAHFLAAPSPRAIALDTDVTLGQINFAGTNAYTLSGLGSIHLQASQGNAALNLIDAAGTNHQIAVPVSLVSDCNVVVRDSSATLTLKALTDAPGRTLTKLGPGTLVIDHVRVNALSIAAGHVVLSDPAAFNEVNGLSIDPTATLDLGTAAFTIDDPSTPVRTWIQDGRLRSTAATNDANRAVGYVIGNGSILLRSTLRGDANLDGVVDFADLLSLARHYDLHTVAIWSDGDATYDGNVDFADLLALARNFGSSATTSVAIPGDLRFSTDWALAQALAPEPAGLITTLSIVACGASRARR